MNQGFRPILQPLQCLGPIGTGPTGLINIFVFPWTNPPIDASGGSNSFHLARLSSDSTAPWPRSWARLRGEWPSSSCSVRSAPQISAEAVGLGLPITGAIGRESGKDPKNVRLKETTRWMGLWGHSVYKVHVLIPSGSKIKDFKKRGKAR